MLDTYLDMLDEDYYEMGEAFKGLSDDHVWQRPSPTLLSIGEIAGHVAYWEAARLAGAGEDLAKCAVTSPLIDARFRYYHGTLAAEPSPEHRAMTAEQVYAELMRVHKESVAYLRALNPDLTAHPPGLDDYWTYQSSTKYLVFHVAYHTGEIYMIRHLLGETPPDN